MYDLPTTEYALPENKSITRSSEREKEIEPQYQRSHTLINITTIVNKKILKN